MNSTPPPLKGLGSTYLYNMLQVILYSFRTSGTFWSLTSEMTSSKCISETLSMFIQDLIEVNYPLMKKQ